MNDMGPINCESSDSSCLGRMQGGDLVGTRRTALRSPLIGPHHCFTALSSRLWELASLSRRRDPMLLIKHRL